MKDIDLSKLLKINAIELSHEYLNFPEQIMAFKEVESIIRLKKLKPQSSISNRIYLNILLQNSSLTVFIKNRKISSFYVLLGKALGYRI